jgi:methyltransferase (TIGR00027 family)
MTVASGLAFDQNSPRRRAGSAIESLRDQSSTRPSVTSRSAALVALARAHLTRVGILDDNYAQQMLPARLAAASSLLRLPVLARLGRNQSFAYLAARTRFYDEFVTDALDNGAGQVVVVGAGFDSRAWRLARPGVVYFEVDLPATQKDKRSRAPQGGPIYVAADAGDSSLATKLTAVGFVAGQKAAFTVEGLTMYLTGDQVVRLLTALAEISGPSSRLAVNFGVGFERHGTRRGRFGRWAMARGGEEYHFRLALPDAPEFLARTGWRAVKTLTGPQLGAEYLADTTLAKIPLNAGAFALVAVRA